MTQQLKRTSYGPHGGGTIQAAVILLHGYGANKEDLVPLAYTWAPHLPHTVFISLDAPTLCPGTVVGRQWFSLVDFDLARIWEDMDALTPSLRATLSQIQKDYNLKESSLSFVGFSQGAALALHQALYATNVAGAISYSGFLVPHLNGLAPQKKPILLLHGDCDTVLPISCLSDSQNLLKKAEVPFESWVCEGLGHGISPFGLDKGRHFLQRLLKDSVIKNA